MIDFFRRLDKFMDYKGLNDNRLSNEAGIPNGLLGKARKRGSLSGKNISKLIKTYPDLSADWLFKGYGNMILDVTKQTNNRMNQKDYIINLQEKTIKHLEDKLKVLKNNKYK